MEQAWPHPSSESRSAARRVLFRTPSANGRLVLPFPPELVAVVHAHLPPIIPPPRSVQIPDGTTRRRMSSRLGPRNFRLHPDLFPIRRYSQFDDVLNRNVSDPLTGIFAALTPHTTGSLPNVHRYHGSSCQVRRIRKARKVARHLQERSSTVIPGLPVGMRQLARVIVRRSACPP